MRAPSLVSSCWTFLLVGFVFSCCFSSVALAQSEGDRAWTVQTKTGDQQIEGHITALRKGKVTIQGTDGKQHEVKLADMPAADQRSALIDWVGAGVVSVKTENVLGDEMGQGSGFVVDESGLLLTNYHVIRGSGKILVAFRVGDRTPVEVQCVAVDRKNDIAVLKAVDAPDGIHALRFVGSKPPLRGANVWTISHPRGFEDTVAWGSVNAVRRTNQMPELYRKSLKADDRATWIQTDAVLKRGSSGGPLIDEQGEVVGMNTWIAGDNLGFAISSRHFKATLSKAESAEPLEMPIEPTEDEGAMAWYCRSVAKLHKKYTEENETLKEETSRLPTKEQVEKQWALADTYQKQFFALAQESPDEWQGLQAIAYTCRLVSKTDESQSRATECLKLLAKHHLGRKDLGTMVMPFARSKFEGGQKFCKFLVMKSPHQKVQAAAAFTIGMNAIFMLRNSEDVDLKKIESRRKLAKQAAAALQGKYAEVEYRNGLKFEAMAKYLETGLESVLIGLPAQEIEGVDMEGETFRLSDYHGKVVMLDFFANWCPYCRRMYPHEREMVTKYKERPFALLGIHCESQEILDELMKKGAVTWRSWADGQQGPIGAMWEITGYPTCYLVDHNGIIRVRFSSLDGEKIDEMIDQILKEAEAAEVDVAIDVAIDADADADAEAEVEAVEVESVEAEPVAAEVGGE